MPCVNSEQTIVKHILEAATLKNASDIKFDTRNNQATVDFKIEGILERFTVIPHQLLPFFISSLQETANLPVGNIVKAADSSFIFNNIAFRVSQIHKSSTDIAIVMRLLAQDKIKSLDGLNLNIDVVHNLRKALSQKEGLILIAGPTDSGKSTTIAAALKELPSGLNIVSAEDPIEYRLDNVTQVQMKESLGYSQIMRQFLRFNPDVIFLGEIRDQESAQLCIEAVRTGHLVITTLHARNIEQIKYRFVTDFKINADDFHDSVVLLLSQRLVHQGRYRHPVVEYQKGALLC